MRLPIQLARPFQTAGEAAGAQDLRLRFGEVQAWFAGQPVYPQLPDAVYPPATYALLWPFLGWLAWPQARLVWFVLSIAAAAGLALLFVRECGGKTAPEKLLSGIVVLAAYGTGVTVTMGQLGAVILLALAGSLLLAIRGRGLRDDLLAGLLFAFALAKPSIAVPFFWLLLFVPKRPRPALVAAGAYAAATLAAVLCQPAPAADLLSSLARNMSAEASRLGGYGNLVNALAVLGHPRLGLPAGAAALLLLGFFVFFHRRTGLWTLIGLTALVARTFTYHRIYDDILVVFPLAALLRIWFTGEPGPDHRVAGASFALLFLCQLIPLQLLDARFGPGAFESVQVVGWLAALGVLAAAAWRERERAPC
jgi:hypothetical protein